MQLWKKSALYTDSDANRQVPLDDEAHPSSVLRSPFRRDYARLLHSPSFRRLQGKTQVFPGDESDFFRNRLTHSLEVAQIAKSIALRINETRLLGRAVSLAIDPDVVEFAGLAHDLGHPPFGHNGEAALDDCMKRCGGFEGNAQTFRILARLEKKQPPAEGTFAKDGRDNRVGLNLTSRSLASVIKYPRRIPQFRDKDDSVKKGIYYTEWDVAERVLKDTGIKDNTRDKVRVIECNIMDLADDIAYSTYDLEDSFKAGFLDPISVMTDIDNNSNICDFIVSKTNATMKTNGYGETDKEEVLRCVREAFHPIVSDMADVFEPEEKYDIFYILSSTEEISRRYAEDGYARTKFTSSLVGRMIENVKVDKKKSKESYGHVTLPRDYLLIVEALKHLTYISTIMSPKMRVAEQRGYDLIVNLFNRLDDSKGYMLMPDDFRDLYELAGEQEDGASIRKRVVSDFIAGMTDRYAVEFYGRLFSENPQSIFKPF